MGGSQVAQERAIRTRQAILDAAGAVFDRHGYGGASMAMIVAESGGVFSQGALYFHFPTKRAVAIAVMETHVSRVQQPVIDLMGKNLPTVDLVLLAMRQFADQLLSDPLVRAGFRLIIEESSLKPESDDSYRTWVAIIREVMATGQAEGEIVRDIGVDALAWHVAATVAGTQICSSVLADREDLLERLEFLWTIMVRAVVVPDRIEYWTTRVEEAFRR